MSTYAQLTDDRLLIINDEGLCLLDTMGIYPILSIENPKEWAFHSVQCDDDDVKVTLKTRHLMEGENLGALFVMFRTDPVGLLSYRDSTISVGDLTFTPVNDTRVQSNRMFPVSDWCGNIYMLDPTNHYTGGFNKVMLDTIEVIPFVPSIKERRYLYGHFLPEISVDGNKILCIDEKSSHGRKKMIEKSQIVEINTKTKEIVQLPIRGTQPMYSRDDNLILFYDIYTKPVTWKIYSKNKMEILTTNLVAHDVVWLY